jgi:hypothetical protein
MSYPIYHGIQLAQSSEIHNLNVQTLADTAIAAITSGVTGRLVYDNVNDRYTYFKSDGSTETITPRSLHDALQALVDTINGDSTIEGSFRKAIAEVVGTTPESLDTLQEIGNALNNDPDLYNTITALISTNIEAAKNELRGSVSESFDTLAEIETKLVDLDSATGSGLANETADRIAADQALQVELDNTQVGAGLAAAGGYSTNTAANYINASTTLKEADDHLDTSLKTEADRAIAAEAGLDGRLSTIESQAGGNIGDLSTLHTDAKDTLVASANEIHDDVVTEKTRAEGVEATLDSNIQAEAAARAAQDDVIEASLGLEADGSIGTGWADMSGGSWASQIPIPPQKVKDLVNYLDKAVNTNNYMIFNHQNISQQNFGMVTGSVGLNYDFSYAPDTAANYIATAVTVADATTKLDSQIKLNTDGLAAEVTRSVALDGNITDGSGLNADGSYKGSGALITKVAAPADIHSAVEGLASMMNTVLFPALGIQTATGTTTGAIKQTDYNNLNYVIAPNSVPAAITQLDSQIKVNSDDIVEEAGIRAAAINAGRLSVGLNSDGSYSPVAGANYIGTASTVKHATEMLDAQIKINESGVANAISAQQTATQVVADELNLTQVGAGLEESGTYNPKADANFIASASSLKGADELLDAAIKIEVDRSTSEDDSIKVRVDALENLDAGSNMGDLSSLLTDAKSSLVSAVNEVDTQQTNIASVVGLVETPSVGGSVYAMNLSTTNYVASAASFNAAIVSVDSKVKELDDNSKARFFTYKSAGPVMSHTITHNLASEFVSVQLWVKSPDDGLYRMDIAEVIEDDNNTMRVVMNSARDIKVVVENRHA